MNRRRPSPLPRPRPTARRWLWTAALLGVIWTLVSQAPASWLAAALSHVGGQRLLLADARGTWHAGSARMVLRPASASGGGDGDGAMVLPGRLSWDLGLGGLWRGRLDVRLQWPELAPQALNLRLQAGANSIGLRQLAPQDWQAQCPADALQGLGAPWNTVAPQGSLELSLHQTALVWVDSRLRMQGELRLDARNISSHLSPITPLGSWRLDIRGDDADAKLVLSTLSGAMVLAGNGSWNGQNLQFSGTARAAPAQQAALGSLLGLIGQPEGDHVRIGL